MKSKITREWSHAYLYHDGTLVEWYEEKRNGNRIAETVDVTKDFATVECRTRTEQGFGTNAKDYGRLVIHRGGRRWLRIAKGRTVAMVQPSYSGGSDNSRKLGIPVGYVEIRFSNKLDDSLSWNVVSGLLSGDFTIQVDPQYRSDAKSLSTGDLWGTGYINTVKAA